VRLCRRGSVALGRIRHEHSVWCPRKSNVWRAQEYACMVGEDSVARHRLACVTGQTAFSQYSSGLFVFFLKGQSKRSSSCSRNSSVNVCPRLNQDANDGAVTLESSEMQRSPVIHPHVHEHFAPRTRKVYGRFRGDRDVYVRPSFQQRSHQHLGSVAKPYSEMKWCQSRLAFEIRVGTSLQQDVDDLGPAFEGSAV